MTITIKRVAVICGVLIFSLIMSACEMGAAKMDDGPSIEQAMRDRAKWLKAMNMNVEKGDFDMIQQDAMLMSDQTRAFADNATNDDVKILTTQINIFAGEIITYAQAKDSDSIKDRLVKMKMTCDECHQEFR